MRLNSPSITIGSHLRWVNNHTRLLSSRPSTAEEEHRQPVSDMLRPQTSSPAARRRPKLQSRGSASRGSASRGSLGSGGALAHGGISQGSLSHSSSEGILSPARTSRAPRHLCGPLAQASSASCHRLITLYDARTSTSSASAISSEPHAIVGASPSDLE